MESEKRGIYEILNSILDFACFIILQSPSIVLDFWTGFNCDLYEKIQVIRGVDKDETRCHYQRDQQGP